MKWFERLDSMEADAQRELALLHEQKAALREQKAALRKQMSAVEERLTRITITRETLLAIAPAMASEDNYLEPDGQQDADAPAADTAAPSTASMPPADRADHSDVADRSDVTVTRPLSDISQRTLNILSSMDQPVRARDVVKALGEPDRRSVVEGTRTRLKRLVAAGHLTERDGLFSIAPGVNGHAREGAAPADQ
jgi:hypothetical protein